MNFNERDVLPDNGSISKKAADEHAKEEYKKFSAARRALKELQGEAESIQVLEALAKKETK